jgi:Uma2 family endonuclease
MATAEALVTAEEYWQLPENGLPTELVRGRIVPMNVPYPRHGQICVNGIRLVGHWLDGHDIGHLVSNDAGVITERDPDTVRGADIAFYTYARVPKGPFPEGYLAVAPDLIFEVRSPADPWKKVLAKVAEYLNAGVSMVCVLDPQSQRIHIYYADQPERILEADEELTLPEVLGDFRAPVRRFFE